MSRNRRWRKSYPKVTRAGGPLFRPLTRDGKGFERRHLDCKTPWRRGQSVLPGRGHRRGLPRAARHRHPLAKTATSDAIRNGAARHEVCEFAGHSDIRTTEINFVRKEVDGEVAARRIQIRLTGRKSE